MAPNESKGHCKHIIFCNMAGVLQNAKNVLDYLCVIEKMWVDFLSLQDLVYDFITVCILLYFIGMSGFVVLMILL